MKLHAAQGFRGRITDLDTGQVVRKVIWFDPDKGELEAHQVDAYGESLTDGFGNYLTYTARGNFKYEPFVNTNQGQARQMRGRDTVTPTNGLPRTKIPLLGAPVCALCGSPLTLPGDDLCAVCRQEQTGPKGRFRVERVVDVLGKHRCCGRTPMGMQCSRLATRSVSDEIQASPQEGAAPGSVKLDEGVFRLPRRVLYDRGATVGRRWYCDWCWEPPRLLDARGERIQDIETEVRPE